MKDFFNKNKTTIFVVSGLALGVIALAFLLPKRDTTGGDELDDPTKGGFNAAIYANQLYSIMSDLGKFRSSDIIGVFANIPQTDQAFNQLKDAFGKRQHNQATGGTSWGKIRDLIEWLEDEMSSNHYNTLKSKYPNQPWI